MAKIKFDNWSFQYIAGKNLALEKINLEIQEGEFVLVTGPTGAGKSTLLMSIVGVVPHIYPGYLEGTITTGGLNPRECDLTEMATTAGIILEDPESTLLTSHVFTEFIFGLENLALPKEEIYQRIPEAQSIVDLHGFDERTVHTLSGGEKQRLVLGACIAMRPDIYVLDEPTAALDSFGRQMVLTVVKKLSQEKKTIIIASHALDELAPLADRMIVLDKGKIALSGKPREVLEENPILRELGVNIPQVAQLAYQLRNNGISLDHIPLTIDEVYEMISKHYRIQ